MLKTKYSGNPFLARLADNFSDIDAEQKKIYGYRSKIQRALERLNELFDDTVLEICDEILASDICLNDNEQDFLNISLRKRDGNEVTLIEDMVGRSLRFYCPGRYHNPWVRLQRKRALRYLDDGESIEDLVKVINAKAQNYFKLVNEGSNRKVIFLSLEFIYLAE